MDNTFKFINNGIFKVKENLEEHLAKKFNINIQERDLKSQLTSRTLASIIKYLSNKNIRPFTRKSGHNYNYHTTIGHDQGLRFNSSGITSGWTTNIAGERVRGNTISWDELYIITDNTIEDYLDSLNSINEEIERDRKKIEENEKKREDLNDIIKYMEINNIKELNKEDYLLHRKLISTI